jgi:hypothetical protein
MDSLPPIRVYFLISIFYVIHYFSKIGKHTLMKEKYILNDSED